MNKITADHLARRACVYVRQSTPSQVQHNLESQRRQYALVDRARALGWQDIDVIDDDLGISGSGTHRHHCPPMRAPLLLRRPPTCLLHTIQCQDCDRS
jgi:hypothetical protein